MPHISTTSLTTRLVTVDTELAFSEVISLLENNVNKNSTTNIWDIVATATTSTELEGRINEIIEDRDFLYFSQAPYNSWLSLQLGRSVPKTVVYTLGNPLIAATILKFELKAALVVPFRLLVSEKEDGSGTTVAYYLPSSLVVLNEEENELHRNVEQLDAKIANLVLSITSPKVVT
ncbi:hypothetical protein FISHEDRAFT_70583 [Fistulina hepatica ATCC 64428]|uniref:DUF302 domain-containing protein n=1 Tax=Fistulina hepatica ATCC 64428 TaxID=1128425 RepID=A0A0D7ALE7_9AGAR|nr:hypothetical protein FISHEDRAFT_70583 [Fistulina hepatica ATCC 64428]